MKTDLLVGATTPAQKAERKAVLHGSAPGFGIVEEILRKRLENLQSQLLKPAYDIPNWAMMQADKIGEARAYEYVIQLLTLDRENN